MASVIRFCERQLKPVVLDASRWKSFAIAYIGEDGNPGFSVSAKNLDEATMLLAQALQRLNVTVK